MQFMIFPSPARMKRHRCVCSRSLQKKRPRGKTALFIWNRFVWNRSALSREGSYWIGRRARRGACELLVAGSCLVESYNIAPVGIQEVNAGVNAGRQGRKSRHGDKARKILMPRRSFLLCRRARQSILEFNSSGDLHGHASILWHRVFFLRGSGTPPLCHRVRCAAPARGIGNRSQVSHREQFRPS